MLASRMPWPRTIRVRPDNSLRGLVSRPHSNPETSRTHVRFGRASAARLSAVAGRSGSCAVHQSRDTPRLAAAIDEMLASAEHREQLHRLIAGLLGHGQEVLGRWAGVMVNSGTYAEIVDRHVELYSRLYWWGSVLDESEPVEEHHHQPKLSRVSPATQTYGSVDDAWLRANLVAIARTPYRT